MLKINNELIVNYEKLVYSIISKYSNETNKDDLFQVGMIGILNASKKYNEKCGVKFTSFAYKYILGEVLKYLREDKNIRLSRDIISDYRKITIAKERIYLNYGRQSSIEELSKVLNISKERILEVERLNEKEVSLNKIISDDEKITLEDTIYNIESVDRNDLINLNDALRSLSKKERKLIYERYYQNKTQTELAKEKNTSQVKIYRYERKVLDKLKDKML